MENILGLCTAIALFVYMCGITYDTQQEPLTIQPEPIIIIEEEPIQEEIVLTKEIIVEEPTEEELMIEQAVAEMDEIESIGDLREWYVAYKEIIAKYEDYFDAPKSIYDSYTDDEINLMCRVIETEAHGLSFNKKCNVASVILNRIEHEKFGDTPTEVCKSPGQFVYTCTKITEDTLLALEYAYQIEDTTGGALYFHSHKNIPEKWNGATLIMTDGSHAFYG